MNIVEISDFDRPFQLKIGNRIVISDALEFATNTELIKILNRIKGSDFLYGRDEMIEYIRRKRYGNRNIKTLWCRFFIFILGILFIMISVAMNLSIIVAFLCTQV
jgi:hypothetical protein